MHRILFLIWLIELPLYIVPFLLYSLLVKIYNETPLVHILLTRGTTCHVGPFSMAAQCPYTVMNGSTGGKKDKVFGP